MNLLSTSLISLTHWRRCTPLENYNTILKTCFLGVCSFEKRRRADYTPLCSLPAHHTPMTCGERNIQCKPCDTISWTKKMHTTLTKTVDGRISWRLQLDAIDGWISLNFDYKLGSKDQLRFTFLVSERLTGFIFRLIPQFFIAQLIYSRNKTKIIHLNKNIHGYMINKLIKQTKNVYYVLETGDISYRCHTATIW